MGSLLIRPVSDEIAKILTTGLNRYEITRPKHYHIREICWDGSKDSVVPPVVTKGLLVAVAGGQERGEFVSGLETVLNDLHLPYPPFVLPWSTAHSPGCDRNGGGGCARCEARSALEEIRSRAPSALSELDAYHEAGHAVIGFSLGMEIDEATLIPHGSGWGWVLPRDSNSFNTVFFQRHPQLARAYAVSLLAGPMSQARHSGRTTGQLAEFCREDMELLGGRQDLRQWDRVARALRPDGTQSDWWVECRSEILRRFDNPEICAAINLVAQQLQRAKHFRNGELNRYLADVGCLVVHQSMG